MNNNIINKSNNIINKNIENINNNKNIIEVKYIQPIINYNNIKLEKNNEVNISNSINSTQFSDIKL